MAYVKTMGKGARESKIYTIDQFRRYKIYITKENKLFARPSITGEKFAPYQENSRLSTINCWLKDIHRQFEITQMFSDSYHKKINYVKKAPLFAADILQSFAPWDDISPEEANEVARLLVTEVFGIYIQGIIATHTDRPHIHNHILLNSVDLQGKKIHDNISTVNKLRAVSDRLCIERGLSIIESD